MQGLLDPSRLSLAGSYDTGSLLSHSTDLSSRIGRPEGIGSVLGKAILSVGETALRGVERVNIWRRLRTTDSIFPHGDGVKDPQIGSTYDDLLELSRPVLYSARVREQSLRLLIVQIATRHTQHLVVSLIKWPTIEISLFLSEIMACMPEEWVPPDTQPNPMRRRLRTVYLTSQKEPTFRLHPALPLFDFMKAIAKEGLSSMAMRAILDAGFLNALLCMCISDFDFNIKGVPQTFQHTAKANAVLICRSLFANLMPTDEESIRIDSHPVVHFFPGPPLVSVDNSSEPTLLTIKKTERRLFWRSFKLSSLVHLRLDAIERSWIQVSSLVDHWKNTWTELVEFIDPQYGARTYRRALECLHRGIQHTGDHQPVLFKILSQTPDDHLDKMFTQYFRVSFDVKSRWMHIETSKVEDAKSSVRKKALDTLKYVNIGKSSISSRSIVISPDNRWIAINSAITKQPSIDLWDTNFDAETPQPTRLVGHERWTFALAFSPDAQKIVTGSDDHTLRIWDLESARNTCLPLEGHTWAVRAVTFSPDSAWVASGSLDKTIRLWDTATGECVLGPLSDHNDGIESLAFSPDGRFLISNSTVGSLRIWNAKNGALVSGPFGAMTSMYCGTVSVSYLGLGLHPSGLTQTKGHLWLPTPFDSTSFTSALSFVTQLAMQGQTLQRTLVRAGAIKLLIDAIEASMGYSIPSTPSSWSSEDDLIDKLTTRGAALAAWVESAHTQGDGLWQGRPLILRAALALLPRVCQGEDLWGNVRGLVQRILSHPSWFKCPQKCEMI